MNTVLNDVAGEGVAREGERRYGERGAGRGGGDVIFKRSDLMVVYSILELFLLGL